MRYSAKLLGLVVVTAVMVPLAENPVFFKEPRVLMPAALAQSAEARKAEADRLLEQGIQQAQVSQFQEALRSWEQALAIYREIGDRDGEGRALGNLGAAYLSLGDYRQAIDFSEQHLAIARETGNRGNEGSALVNLGSAYHGLGAYQQAIEFHEQSLAIARETGHRANEGRALGSLGLAYGSLGDYRRAIAFHQQDLAITREIGDRIGEGGAFGNLGGAYLSLGDYRQAIDFFERYLAIAGEIGDRRGEGIALGSLGLAHRNLGNYYQALEFYEQSLVITWKIGDQGGEVGILGNLGIAYFDIGNYRRAIDFQEQSLTIAQEIGDRSGEGRALGNLGIAYESLGDFHQAIAFHERDLAITREIGDRSGEGSALGGLGNAYYGLGNYRQAIMFHEQSLVIAHKIADRRGEGAALGNLGNAYSGLGSHRQAVEFYEQHLAITHEIGDRLGEGLALNNLGFTYLIMEQFALAETALAQALDVRDALRDSNLQDADKISLFETQRNSFLLLQRALVAQGKVGSALAVAERGRGRAFAELLSQRLPTNEAALNPAPPNLGAIQALAQQQQSTLVQYSLIRSIDDYTALYIWVVSPTGDISFRRQPLDDVDLSSLVTTTRQAIGVRGDRANLLPPPALAHQQAQTETNLRQLYDLLIAPIADLLPADPDQPVVFMPQDELFLVPFAALKAPNDSYLIENHTILTAPSIQVFGLANDISRGPAPQGLGNALIVGNPTMPTVTFFSESGTFQDVRLDPLSGAQREAEAISSFLQTPALIGSAATEAVVKQRMAQSNVIHLATHGLLEYGDPRETGTRDLPGAIALAPGNGEDGLLTAAEILPMTLQADLVVLSACDTGRGRITGDGVVGLSRALVAAGVPSTMVSLWAVDDAATADLMVAFYDHWQQSGNKAQALRQAMLTTMAQHPDPLLWAAFTLIGSAE